MAYGAGAGYVTINNYGTWITSDHNRIGVNNDFDGAVLNNRGLVIAGAPSAANDFFAGGFKAVQAGFTHSTSVGPATRSTTPAPCSSAVGPISTRPLTAKVSATSTSTTT